MGWIAGAISIGGSILGSIGQSEQHKDDQKFSIQELLQQSADDRETSQFNAEQMYYYNQLKRQDEQRGLDQFAKFNTVKDYAPDYVNTSPRVVVPDKPVWNQGEFAPPVTPEKKKGGGFMDIFGKIDPGLANVLGGFGG